MVEEMDASKSSFANSGLFWVYTTIVGLFATYYIVGTTYIYQYLKTTQGDITDSSSVDINHIATIFGTCFIISIALAVGLILITLSWTIIENKAILSILISTVALLIAVSAITAAALTNAALRNK
jgi:hypothetical protein